MGGSATISFVTEFDRDVAERYAAGVVAHIAFHSAYVPPPQRYLVALPEGRYAQFQDIIIRRRRTLVSYGTRPVVGGRVITGFLDRPRDTGDDGPWFTGLTEPHALNAFRDVLGSLQRAWDGRELLRDETAILIEPLTAPKPVDVDDAKARMAKGWLR